RHLHTQGKIHNADDAGKKGWCAGLVLLVLHSGYTQTHFEIIVDASGDAGPEIVFLVIQVPALPHSFFIKVTQRSKVLDGFRAAGGTQVMPVFGGIGPGNQVIPVGAGQGAVSVGLYVFRTKGSGGRGNAVVYFRFGIQHGKIIGVKWGQGIGKLLDLEVTGVIDHGFSDTTLFSGNQNNTIGGLYSKYRSRCILQNADVFDDIWVQSYKITLGHFHAVDDEKGIGKPPDIKAGVEGTGFTRVLHYADAR